MARRSVRSRRLAMRLLATISQWPASWRGVHGSIPCSNESYNWMNNADGKSPCDVYVVLMAQCDTRNCLRTDVSPRTYLRARDQLQSPCFCNAVSYSLRAACELCTDVSLQTEKEYIAGQCNESFPQTFPCPLPPDVAIPGWAYQSVVVNDLFNVTLASQFTNRETTSLSTVPDHGHSSFGATSTAAASSATQILTISPSAPATAPQPSVQLTAISSSQSTLTQTNSLGKTTVPQTGGSSPSRLSTGPSGPAIPASSTTFLLTTPAVATTTISESVQSNASINQAKSPGPLIGAVVGGLVLFNIVVVLVVMYIRRRRRQRVAALESEPLDWWRRPPESLPQPVHRAASECTTITPEDGDLLSDDEFAKKSVMYGNYPDI